MASLSSTISKSLRTAVVVALLLTAVLLLAFGPRASGEFPKDRVIVDYWEHWGGAEEAGMRRDRR